MTAAEPNNRNYDIADPLDWEVVPGVRVRDVETQEHCRAILLRLETEVTKILGQIGWAETDPSSVQPGWRNRAQAAIRWKKLGIKAMKARAQMLEQAAIQRRRQDPTTAEFQHTKGAAILKVIREEVGEVAFEAFVTTARRRYPDAFGAVDTVNSGEN